MAWEIETVRDADQVMGFKVRWDMPAAGGEYLYVRHYMAGENGGDNLGMLKSLAEKEQERLNLGATPMDYGFTPINEAKHEDHVILSDMQHDRQLTAKPPIVVHEGGGKASAIAYRFDLVPTGALLAVANTFHLGAATHGEDDWKKLPMRKIINHAIAHLVAFMNGDRSEDHLAHAACRALMAAELEIISKEAENAK